MPARFAQGCGLDRAPIFFWSSYSASFPSAVLLKIIPMRNPQSAIRNPQSAKSG
jgi:hypothetical protein